MSNIALKVPLKYTIYNIDSTLYLQDSSYQKEMCLFTSIPGMKSHKRRAAVARVGMDRTDCLVCVTHHIIQNIEDLMSILDSMTLTLKNPLNSQLTYYTINPNTSLSYPELVIAKEIFMLSDQISCCHCKKKVYDRVTYKC